MQNHTKVYLTFFGYRISSDVHCEICGSPAVDINHIWARGMGGNPLGDKDEIENLMAMCRAHHEEYGDVVECKPMLRLIHLKYMKYNGLKVKIALLNPPLEVQIKKQEVEVNNNVGPQIFDIKP